MLTHVSIRNVILIDLLELDLNQGLCVLTGETGAGKSILLDALGFVLGGRASHKLIRQGADKAVVAATFDVSLHPTISHYMEELGIDQSNELMLRRILTMQGKSKAFINDNPVTISSLKLIGSLLVEVHGQHEQSSLLDSNTNRDVLDAFGQYEPLLVECQRHYQSYIKCKTHYDHLVDLQNKAEEEHDYIQYVCQELDQLDLEVDETDLVTKRRRFMNDEKLSKVVKQSYELISQSPSVESVLHQTRQMLDKHTEIEPQFIPIVDALERASIECNEAVAELSAMQFNRNESGGTLELIEQKLFSLRGAARKYRIGVAELKQFKQEMEDKKYALEHKDDVLQCAKNELDEAKEGYISVAERLTHERQKSGSLLSVRLMDELKDLKMERTSFEVSINPLLEERWGPRGVDHIQFLASTNPGMPAAALSKIASGGELSRFMLALKVVLSHVKSVPCIIFDEIDAGVGGAVADAIGRRLRLLGENVQVLVVTHQAQVASKGHMHMHIKKTQSNDSTKTDITILDEGGRIEELGRMLSGSDTTDEARAAAKQLMTTT